MILSDIAWLWEQSGAVCAGRGAMLAAKRVRFVLSAFGVSDLVIPFIRAPNGSALRRLMQSRPETIGAVVWPYQCSAWDARMRLARILDHYAVVARIGGAIDFPVDQELRLLDLHNLREGLAVVVDQPKWFMREGQITINLFSGDTRLYSLAFSLFPADDGFDAYVGAIQGRDIEGALEHYRDLTKAAHGMRPRDLIIELFRMFCIMLGVREIFAVSDAYRHHRSPYFGKSTEKKSAVDYDEVWEDRGGVRVDDMTYRLGRDSQHKDLADVPTKKRAMYRRRYQMLEVLNRDMRHNYHRGADAPLLRSSFGKPGEDGRDDILASGTGADPQRS